jgi:hypothetical protein
VGVVGRLSDILLHLRVKDFIDFLLGKVVVRSLGDGQKDKTKDPDKDHTEDKERNDFNHFTTPKVSE